MGALKISMDTHLDELFNRTRLGEFLHQQNLIAEEQLNTALQKQKSEGTKLGQILVQSGQLDHVTIERVLLQQRALRGLGQAASRNWIQQQTRFGTLAHQLNLIDQEQLDEALRKQKITGKALGEVLVEQGHISIQSLHETLRFQHKLRRTLVAALVSLITATLIAPTVSFAEASIASAQISITLHFAQPMPIIETSPSQDEALPVLAIDGVTLTPDATGGYDLSPLDDLPANTPSRSIDFSLEHAEQLPLSQGSMTLYMLAR